MSANIDNRIVEMRFDNAQFEKGVQTSIKSLDELKKGLELDKAAASLSNLEKTANKFDLSAIENAVTSLQQRFSTLGIIGMTALENITNRAVNAGVQMMKSLSIDQITSGMSKYEAETASVATMRYAIDDGTTVEGTQKIYEAIEKLQSYADETSYSFSTMVDNMGKFVNAGVDLEKAERSMEGIANWAAKSGVSAQSANFSRVMYNLSQAMGQGQVRLMDWMSIENAQMATMGFKNMLLETAESVGTLEKKSDGYYTKAKKGNKSVKVTAEDMRNTLQQGWLTADVLTETLGKYADRTTEFGHEAFLAAQQARSFTDAIEATKDAVSTGWARSFRIIFGDINQATDLFTGMANGMIEVVDGIQEFRNSMLEAWAADKGRQNLIDGFVNIWHILQAISTEVGYAFGWLTNGVADRYGQKLAELSEGFKKFTDKGLGLIDKRTVKKKIGGGTEEMSDELKSVIEFSSFAEDSIRSMISTKMKPGTVEKWEACANAFKDLQDYANSGSVSAEELEKKMTNVNGMLEELKKTNGLKDNKKKAIKAMQDAIKLLDETKNLEKKSSDTTETIASEEAETETTITYYSKRLRPMITGMANAFLIFGDVVKVTWGKLKTFAEYFAPLINPVMNLASAVGDVITHIRETGVVTDMFGGWIDQLTEALSPITDKVKEVGEAIEWFQKILFSRDYDLPEYLDKNNNGPWSFFNGPIGEKILNVAAGIRAFGNIAVKSLASSLRSGAEFISGFILPLVGPVAGAALDFLSGLGKVLVWLDEGLLTKETFDGAVAGITGFIGTIRDMIVNNPIFQRVKTILTAFFTIWSKDPKAAINYIKAVGRGLLEGVKKSELYKKAAGYLTSFYNGIKATFKNSKTLKKARAFASSFFKAFKKDPKTATKALGQFIKNMVMFSKPVQLLKGFGEKAKTFLSGLFPQGETSKVQRRMNNLKEAFKKTWETKGLSGVLSLVGSLIKNKLREWGEAFTNSPVGQKLIALKNYLVSTWNNLMTELENNPLVQRIKGFLDRLAAAYEENGIGGAIELLKTTVVNKFNELKNAFLQNGIVQAAINLKNRIKTALDDFAKKVGLDKRIEEFKKWMENLKKTFNEKGPLTALSLLKTSLALKFQTFTANFNLQNIIAKVKEWVEQLKESIRTANVGEAFDELKNTIKEKIKTLFPSMSEVAEDGGGKGKGFIGNIISTIQSWVGSFKEFATNNLKGISIDPIVKNIMKGLAFAMIVKGALVMQKVWSGFGDVLKKLGGNSTEKKVKNVSRVLTSLAIVIGVLAGSLWLLSSIPAASLWKAVGALLLILGAIAALAAGIKMFHLESAMDAIMKAGIGVAAIGFAILELVAAIAWLSKMDFVKEFLKGLGMVAILMVALGGFIVAMNKLGGNGFTGDWKTTLAEIVAVAGAIWILTFAVSNLANLSLGQAIQGVIGTVVLLGALGGVVIAISKFKGIGKTTLMDVLQLIAIGWVIGDLVKSVSKLGKLGLWQAVQGVLGVVVLMGAFGGLFVAMNKFATNDPMKMAGILVSAIVMAGLLWVFTEAVLKVAAVPWQTMIGFAGSFAIFVLALSGAIALLSAIPFTGLVSASAGIGLAIIALGGALSLAAMMGGNAAQGLAGNMWVVGSKLSSYSTMVSDLDTTSINNSFQIMKDFMTTALEVVGTPDLSTFRKTLIDTGADLSVYNTNVSTLDTVKFNASIQAMKDFASASDEVTGKDYSALATFGKTMQQVGGNLRLYSLLTTDIDVSKSEMIKTAAADIGTVYNSLKDVKDVGDLTTAITHIGSALKLYYSQVNGITMPEEGSEGPDLSNIQQIFRDLADAMPTDDTIKDISSYAAGGGNDMTQFALGLEAIGTALKDLGTNTEGITSESLKPALDLIGVLTTLNESLKPEKFSLDFLGAFHVESETGTADLQQFATDIVTLGGAIKGYGESVQGVTSESIEPSLGALDFFQKLRDKIKGNGWEGFSLDFLNVFHAEPTEIDQFVEDIVKLGGAVANFANSLKGKDGKGLNSSQIEVAKSTIGFIADLNNALPETGGLKQIFSGSQSLDDFASAMSTLGDGLAQFADKTADHDYAGALSSIDPLIGLARAHKLINGAANWIGLNSFGETLPTLGENLVKFQTGAEGLDASKCMTITRALTALIGAAQDWAGVTSATQGAENVRNFLSEMLNGRASLFNESFGELTGQLAAEFWASFYQAVNDQNGSYNVAPNGMALSPTIKPVYDWGNLTTANGAVNGNLQNTLDTTGATLNVSAVSNAVNQAKASLCAKLDISNMYLAQINNTTSKFKDANHSDLGVLNTTTAALGGKLQVLVQLDGQTIAAQIIPLVDSGLGKRLGQ